MQAYDVDTLAGQALQIFKTEADLYSRSLRQVDQEGIQTIIDILESEVNTHLNHLINVTGEEVYRSQGAIGMLKSIISKLSDRSAEIDRIQNITGTIR